MTCSVCTSLYTAENVSASLDMLYAAKNWNVSKYLAYFGGKKKVLCELYSLDKSTKISFLDLSGECGSFRSKKTMFTKQISQRYLFRF